MEEELKEQQGLYDEIKRFQANFKKAPTDRKTSKGYLSGRLNGLQELWKSFEARNRNLIRLSADNVSSRTAGYFVNNVYNEIEVLYYDLFGIITDLIDAIHNETLEGINTPTREEQVDPSYHLKLPSIQIPTFSGSYEGWLPFKELFTAVIGQDRQLSPVQKLHYLKSCLSGEASKLIQHLPTTSANYEPAWKMLINRYNNKRVLVNSQLKMLVNQSVHKLESAGGIRSMLDETTECLQSLNSLGLEIRNWDPLVIHILVEKLSFETQTKWQDLLNSKETDDLPTFDDFQTFLEQRFRSLEALGAASSKQQSSGTLHQQQQASSKLFVQLKCSLCRGEHNLSRCERFKQMNASERNAYVSRTNYCFNCLLLGHISGQCKSEFRCRVCRQKHHSLLHPDTQIPPPFRQTTHYKDNQF